MSDRRVTVGSRWRRLGDGMHVEVTAISADAIHFAATSPDIDHEDSSEPEFFAVEFTPLP